MRTVRLTFVALLAAAAAASAAPSAAPEEAAALTVVEPTRQPLPDTSAISGELTEKHGVSKFFSLWLVFNDPAEIDVKLGVDYVILAPKEPAPLQKDTDPQDRPAIVKKLLLDHVILGQKLNLTNREDKSSFTVATLGGRDVEFSYKDNNWYANDALIVESPADIPPNGELVVLNKYAFADYNPLSSISTSEAPSTSTTAAPFIGDFAEELINTDKFSGLNRMPLFTQFLRYANVSELLKPDEKYTVLIPMDRAFQKWHPIDWGFYPFDVPEFTKEVVRNHFIRGTIRPEQITEEGFQTTSLTNKTLIFKKTAKGVPTVNDISMGSTGVTMQKGTAFVIYDVLFVDYQVVQDLRLKNLDKETPPLIAFPWWNAQFLSHSYLKLERNGSFPSAERLLNVATDLHLHVPGKDYSFFVPTENAFKKAGLAIPSGWSERHKTQETFTAENMKIIEKFFLRHLVKGRLYMKELIPDFKVQTLDNSTLTFKQKDDKQFVSLGELEAQIVEGNYFVYNLGTIFFVDTILTDDLDELKTLIKEAVVVTEPAKEVEDVTEILSPV
ncbi:uncharacterized protein LOC132202815 isoform X2 [Neocloeon triangulifer]|nr:uncharacterized protein LOC132202815 isoform X2 [Neocloeon triangulifer]